MAIGNSDGTIMLSVQVDEQTLKKALNGVENSGKKVNSTFSKIGTTIAKGFTLAATAATVAIVGITKQSVSAYAEYEQLVGGVETLFKGAADKVKAYAEDAFYTAGVSANEYMQQVTSFSASLISSCAGDTDKAADIANMALIDISDNINKMGSSTESVTLAYQGFAKQQYMLLDNLKLGYGGTKTEMQRLLKDAQAITGVKYDINNLADVYNALHVIQEQLGITGTTAKEAEQTISGSANMMKASWQNVLAAISGGGDLDRAINNLVYSITKVFENISPVVQRALIGVGQAIEQIAPMLAQNVAIAIVQSIPSVVNAIYAMFISAAKGIWAGIKAIFTGKSSGGSITAQLNKTTSGTKAMADSIGTAADNQDKLTKGVKGTNKELKKTLAGFDELQILSDTSSTGESGGSSGNTTAKFETTLQDISNFELDDKFYQSLQAIAVLVGTIGGALLAWAITDQLLNNTEQFLGKLTRISGIAMTVAGAILLIKGYCDGWVNGIGWGNYSETLSGLALLLQGISILISPIAAAWTGVGGGIALAVLAIKDMITNGVSLQNVLMALTGVAITTLSVLTAIGKLKFAMLSGSLFALAGIFATVYGVSDAWVNGLDWLNFIAIVGGLVTAFISLQKVLEPLAIKLFPSLFDTIGTVIGGMLAAAAGIVMVVAGMKDLVDNGPSVQNMLLLLGGTAAIAIGMATAGFSVLVTAIVAVIALIGSFVISLATEKSAIMSVEEAQENLTEAKEKAKQAEDDYIASVDNAEAALKKLEEAEKATGLSGQELYEQVQQGTLDYKDMTDQQKEVYKAYLDNEKKQKDLKEATEEYTKATKDETIASYENELALAKENETYGEFKKSVVDAFKQGRLSAEEARELIGKSMSEMSDDAQQTFMEDLPNDIKDGLDPKNYETFGKKLKDWFGNLFDGIKNTFKKLKNAITGDSDVKNATSGSKSGGVSTQSLSNISVTSGVSFQIPALARGAVIPANREFLAVLGDQKHGTNVEAPAELIKQMAKEAYQEMGLTGGQNQQVIKEEHYNLNQTELMTIIYKLVKGGERLNGTSLVKQGGI